MNGMNLKKFADAMDEAANAYLNGGSFFEAKDIYFGVFKRDTGLPIEALEPGPFQHTGIYSSRHLRDTNSFAWYMASRNFESVIENFLRENMIVIFVLFRKRYKGLWLNTV